MHSEIPEKVNIAFDLQETIVLFRIRSLNPSIRMAHNLLDLCDDVLLHIFIDLNISNLSDIASTCTRLRNIARRAFILRQNTMNIDLTFRKVNDDYITHYRRLSAILRNFGDLLTNLEVVFFGRNIEKTMLNTRIFNLMVMYCPGPFERLTLDSCRLQADKAIDATPFFRNVRELVLRNSEVMNFLLDATQMTRLSLNGYSTTEIVQLLSRRYRYPQLQSLALNDIFADDIDAEAAIKNALKRHTRLTEIDIENSALNGLYLVSELPELRKLSLSIDSTLRTGSRRVVPKLEKVTELKLTIVGGFHTVGDFLLTSELRQSLEKLELFVTSNYVYVWAIMHVLGGLTNLKYLSIDFEQQDFHDTLLIFLHRLTKLRVLSISGRLCITSDGLVNLVRNLPHLELLILDAHIASNHIQLRSTTCARIAGIYRERNKKLKICNCNVFLQEREQCKHMETLAHDNHVQFIDDHRRRCCYRNLLI